MSVHAKRFALLMVAFCSLAFALAACAAPTSPIQSSQSDSGVNVFHTPNPALASPTPTFPPFTVGAWPSNYSPGNKDNITIYVLCRVQPRDMNGPSTPPQAGMNVTVQVLDPINQTYQGSTDAEGLAAVQVPIDDSQSGKPVSVTVTVNYNNSTYTAQTFFTPNPTQGPTPTPNPNATPGGTVTPSATPKN